ncbi:MAG: helix-turn-helix domain-containing protein [Patescibacteria group bacterium]
MEEDIKNDEKISLGEAFRREREKREITVEDIAKKLSVSPEHIRAIEDECFSFFSAFVYAKGLARRYAATFEFDEELCVKEFDRAWNARARSTEHRPVSQLLKKKSAREYITPQIVLFFAGILCATALILYFANSTFITIRTPSFTLDEPREDTLTAESVLTIRGTADSHIELTLNKQPVYIDASGKFSRTIVLQRGINTLTLEGKNSFGRTAVIQRRVVSE